MNDFDLSKVTGDEPSTVETRCCEDCEREWFYIDNEDECPWCEVESQAKRIKDQDAALDNLAHKLTVAEMEINRLVYQAGATKEQTQ